MLHASAKVFSPSPLLTAFHPRYTVATTNYPPPPPNPDGCELHIHIRPYMIQELMFVHVARPAAKTSWHHILSFNPSSYEFLKTLQKGAHVYVEANYELREPDSAAEADSPQSQRQIFLRHGMSLSFTFSLTLSVMSSIILDMIRLLKGPSQASTQSDAESESI